MTSQDYIPDNNHVKKITPYIIAATAIISYLITLHCLINGINIIYPHLYYIPIILTALFYPKKGTYFAILIGIVYLFTTYVITNANETLIYENLIRVTVFIGVAAVISRISFLLREDNIKYKNLIDSSGAASAVLDDKGKILHINSTFEKITGRTLKELRRINWVSIFDNEYRGTALMLYRNSVEGEEEDLFNKELILRSKEGDEYCVLATINHIPELQITLLSLIDITEKKKIERMVAVQKERYKKLFQQSIDGILIHNNKGKILNANTEALRILGMDLQGLKKTNLKNLIPDNYNDLFNKSFLKAIKEGKVVNKDISIESKNGDKINLDLRSVMVDKETEVILTIARDITTRKKNEEALKIAMKKLNILSSITRHDIINYIMVAKVNLEFALEDTSDEPIRNFLKKSYTALDTIQLQIEFTRDYQDMGGNPPKWHRLKSIVDSCIESQGLPPSVRVEEVSERVMIFADPMLEKVICNLIGNTIMHGADVSQILIHIEEEEDCFKLIYEDDGKGIPKEDKNRIFRPGYGENQGFGLYLVSEILAITGASIKENGISGKGVRFEISFPKNDVYFEQQL